MSRPLLDIAVSVDIIIAAELLNAGNTHSAPAEESDVTVVGGGIHGLIYAIHARKAHPEANLRISLFEKAPRPQWKVNITQE